MYKLRDFTARASEAVAMILYAAHWLRRLLLTELERRPASQGFRFWRNSIVGVSSFIISQTLPGLTY